MSSLRRALLFHRATLAVLGTMRLRLTSDAPPRCQPRKPFRRVKSRKQESPTQKSLKQNPLKQNPLKQNPLKQKSLKQKSLKQKSLKQKSCLHRELVCRLPPERLLQRQRCERTTHHRRPLGRISRPDRLHRMSRSRARRQRALRLQCRLTFL
jgi:hypothetical protein